MLSWCSLIFPATMFFILFISFILGIVLSFITYRLFKDVLIPVFWKSNHIRKFRESLSKLVVEFFRDVRWDIYSHLEIMCNPEGVDEYKLCNQCNCLPPTPCDFVSTSPEESELLVDENQNRDTTANNEGRRAATRRRRIVPVNELARLLVVGEQANANVQAGEPAAGGQNQGDPLVIPLPRRLQPQPPQGRGLRVVAPPVIRLR